MHINAFKQVGQGVLLGVVVGWGLAVLLDEGEKALEQGVWDYIWQNLGLSIAFFILDAAAFIYLFRSLDKALGDDSVPAERLLHLSNLLNYSITCFLVIGVLFTAIGMRNALLYALGDPAAQDLGAFEMLKRMVEGGILVALSTTIVGYVGEVGMRILRKIRLDYRLNRRLALANQRRQKSLFRAAVEEAISRMEGNRDDAP